jgi:endoglucanase
MTKIRTRGDSVVDGDRNPVRLRGAGLGGWTKLVHLDLQGPGPQGLASVRPDSPYLTRFGEFIAKKDRLAADSWGSDGIGPVGATAPFQDMMEREFPAFDPYPWGRRDWVRTLILNITVAQPPAYEYAQLFRGLDDGGLIALADSFALANCDQRTTLQEQLQNG